MKKSFFLILFIFAYSFAFSQHFSKTDSLLEYIKTLASDGQVSRALQIIDSISSNSSHSNEPEFKILKAVLYLDIYENKVPGSKDNMLLENAYRNLFKARVTDSTHSLETTIKDLIIRVASHFLYQGVYDFNKKRYKLALNEFLKAEQIYKQPFINLEDTMLYFSIGQAALKVGDTSLATKYLSLAYEKDYYSPVLTMQLYDIYHSLGKEDSAIYFLKKGAELFPKDKNILNTLANYYLDIQAFDKARPILKQLISIDSSSDILYSYATICLMDGDTSEAETYFLKSLENNPQNKDALYNLGLMYYSEAISMLKKNPEKKTIKSIKPLLKKSEQNLKKLILLEPNNQTAFKMLESIYKLLGNKHKQKKIKKMLNGM